METKLSIEKILRDLRTNRFVMECGIPMGYVPGLPILQIKRQQLCLLVPFLKYKVTGRTDGTQVYPIRYTLLMVLPERRIVGFSDLAFDDRFSGMAFDEPVGLFRHEAVRGLTRQEYRSRREQLLAEYDAVANMLLYGAPYGEENEQRMRSLLKQLVEPAVVPIMRTLDADFCRKYDL